MRSFSLVLFIVSISALALGCEKSRPMQTNTPPALGDSSGGTAGTIAPNTVVMYVHGMACPQCAYNVDLQLLKVQGVKNVKVDMSTGRVIAEYSPDHPPTREQLAKAIAETGFTLVKIQMR